MKISLIILSFIFATSNLSGQILKYYVNDTLVDKGSDHCWTLTKKFNAPYIGVIGFDYITNAEIVGKNLKLTLELGGGCGSNYFKLYLDNSFDIINDSIIRLSPEAKSDDPCFANFYITLCFNLEEIINVRTKPLLLEIGRYNFIIDKN